MNESKSVQGGEPFEDSELPEDAVTEPVSDGSGDPNRDRADQMHEPPVQVDEKAVRENSSE